MKQAAGKTGLLFEIIISTVFFSMICVVVLQLFMYARDIEQYSRDKSSALALAQSVGDMFRSEHDFGDLLNRRYAGALTKDSDFGYTIRIDEDAGYGAALIAHIAVEEVKTTPAGTLSRALIKIERNGTVLYELTVDKYMGR